VLSTLGGLSDDEIGILPKEKKGKGPRGGHVEEL